MGVLNKLKIDFVRKHKTTIILGVLIIIALGTRIYMLSISDNGWGADPDERIRLTANWLNLKESRPIFLSPRWLPLHFYLIAFGIKIFNSIPLGPRLLHLILGVLTIFPFYNLIRLVFNSRVALISTLIFIFYPLHILCSIITLSEGPFLFFFLSSLYYLFRYLQKNDSHSLSLSCIFLILASVLRYEAWIFVIITPALLAINKKFKEGFIFLYISSLLPFLWSMSSPISESMYMVPRLAKGSAYHYYSWFHWLQVVVEYFSLPLAIFLISGFCFSIKNKYKIYLLVICGALFLFFTGAILRPTLLNNIEFSLSFTSLLIPFAVLGFDKFLDNKLSKFIMLPVFLGFIIFYMVSKAFILTDSCRYPDYIKKIAGYLEYRTEKNTNILLNNYRYQSNHIPVYIGKDFDRFSISGPGGDFGLRGSGDIMQHIIRERPKYIVYSDEGELKFLFKEEYLLRSGSGIFLSLVFESGPYKIFKLTY